jgi:hypothetical protein
MKEKTLISHILIFSNLWVYSQEQVGILEKSRKWALKGSRMKCEETMRKKEKAFITFLNIF